MAIRVSLTHTSRYRYDREVTLLPHVVRLRPAPHGRTPILAYSLRITPKEHFLNWQQDPFGNYQARLVFNKPARELTVEVDLVAEMIALNPFDFFVEEYAENYGFRYEASLARELAPYSIQTAPEARFGKLIEEVHGKYARPGRRNIDVLVDINRDISQRLRYDLRMEPGVFEPEETLVRGHGSCRDFAWLEVELLRRLGYAARFVSGYSIQLKPDVKPLDGGPAGVSEDIADLHAWVEVYLPGAGWIGLDATSGLLAGEGHIPLACTPEPGSAAPVTGSFSWTKLTNDEKLAEGFGFSMTVERIAEAPRSTKPYSDEMWSQIAELGYRVDEALKRDDVRLSMGGEPTFVYAADADAPEWNTTALGGAKFRLADALARRLRQKFAPGGLLFHGQGKWYPGEPLPRWGVACYFRSDGVPVWQDANRIVPEDGSPSATGISDAKAFIAELAKRLGVDDRHTQPAYEDAWYYLWRERRLPINVDPLDSRLDDKMECQRLNRVFERSIGAVVGFALPLTDDGGRGWQSGPWFLRHEHLFLTPGDSPMGFRLPLDSLPWLAPGDREESVDPDPLAKRPRLPAHIVLQASQTGKTVPAAPPQAGQSAVGLVRTALCAETRQGVLHVFLPPLSSVDAFLALVTAIEETAASQNVSLRLEGYPPPSEDRKSV